MLGGWVCELEGDTFGTLRRRRLVQRDSLGQIDRERGERGEIERVEGSTLVDMQSEIVDERVQVLSMILLVPLQMKESCCE